MNMTLLRMLGIGALFLLCIASGLWLAHAHKPLSTILFNLHKFIALGAVALLGITIYQVNQIAPLSSTEIILCAVSGVLILGTIITGGLISTGNAMPLVVSTAHQVLPYLTVLCVAGTLYLLNTNI